MSPLFQPRVPQPYHRALLSPWHLLRVEWSKASSPESAPGSSRGCHPTARLCASPATPLFEGVQLPAWPSSPRTACLPLLPQRDNNILQDESRAPLNRGMEETWQSTGTDHRTVLPASSSATPGSDQGGAQNLEPSPDLYHKCVSAPGSTAGDPGHPAMSGDHPTGMVHADTLPGEFLQQGHLHAS